MQCISLVIFDPRSESRLKHYPLVCLFVYLSVCMEFFSGSAHSFSYFLLEIRCHLIQKVTELDFFKNSYSGVFMLKGPKIGPKWGFSSLVKNRCREFFRSFGWSHSKIKSSNSHKWFFWVFGQTGAKMRFFKFYKKISEYFALSCSSINV